MSDLISREDAIEALKRAEALAFAFGYHNVIGTIRELPTIDAVEVVHGKWIEKDDDIITGTCSVCGWDAIFAETDVTGMPYCPCCGARMDGRKDDESNRTS